MGTRLILTSIAGLTRGDRQTVRSSPAVVPFSPAVAPSQRGQDRPFPPPTSRLALCLLGLLVLGGCGTAAYERRFDETRKYFAYLDRLNQYLSRAIWKGDSLRLRVPKQFQPIAAPPAPKEGEEATADKDPRQPPFLDSPLPGLQGAWQADLALVGSEGRGRAYLYVLSNYELLGAEATQEQATLFNEDIIKRLATAAGQEVPTPDKLNVVEVPKGPKSDAYVKKLFYKSVTPAIPFTFQDKPYRIEIYDYQKEKSPAEVSIVLVAPDNVSPSEKLDRAMTMCLETLEITQDKPTQVPGKGGPGGPGKSAKPTGI